MSAAETSHDKEDDDEETKNAFRGRLSSGVDNDAEFSVAAEQEEEERVTTALVDIADLSLSEEEPIDRNGAFRELLDSLSTAEIAQRMFAMSYRRRVFVRNLSGSAASSAVAS